MDIELAKKVSVEAAKEAGTILMSYFRELSEAIPKGEKDIVTKADLQAEHAILTAIQSKFPGHSILSEEKGFLEGDKNSRYVWVIDPLDGTINYYYGMNPFRVGVCLLEDKHPILASVYNPAKDQLFFAEKGRGAAMNDLKMHVSGNSELKQAVIMTHLSSKSEARKRTISALEAVFTNSMRIRMFGSGLAAMTYVARGTFDVFFNVETSPWDILPGALLIQEAGGMVTDIKGKEIGYESTSVLATNGKVHDQMLKLLENV